MWANSGGSGPTAPLPRSRAPSTAASASSAPQGWRAVLASVVVREAVPGGLRLRFDPEQVRLGALAELAAAEADCCAFLDLGLHLGPAPTLEVRAPADARVAIDELLVEPDARRCARSGYSC